MPESYEEATRKEQEETDEEDEHLEGHPNYADEVGPDLDTESLEESVQDLRDISVTTPDFLTDEAGEGVGDQLPGGGRRAIGVDVSLGGLEGDLNEIQSAIESIGSISDIDLDGLGTQGLLRVIAQTLINGANLNSLMARQSTIQLVTLLDIANAVEALNTITVSGVNAIENANEPEPIVPQADEQSIPTRRIYFRADPKNNEPIWIGDDDVSPNSGIVLRPGENGNVPIDFRQSQLYMSSNETGQLIQLLGVL